MNGIPVERSSRGLLLSDGTLRLAADEPQLGLAAAARGQVILALRGYVDAGDGPVRTGQRAAEWLAARYLRHGEAFLDDLAGGYALILADLRRGRRYAATDSAGEGSLFTARYRDRTAVGTEPADTAAAVGADRPSLAGFAQFLLLNYTLNDSWYVEGVRPVAPGRLHLLEADGPRPVRTIAPFPGRPDRERPVPPGSGELAEALGAVSLRLTQGAATLHLSGGVDTSLIAHALRRPPYGRVPSTYSAFYRRDDADRSWAACVAAETGSEHHEIAMPVDESFFSVVDALVDALGAPVMAIGVPTFWHLGQAARQDGVATLLSGVAADHALVGWNRLDRLAASPAEPDELPVLCAVHIPPAVLAPYVAHPELRTALAEVGQRVRAQMPGGRSPAQAIERFHAEHFLPEHLRSAAVAHGLHGVQVRHPFLAPEVSGLCFRAAVIREESLGKRYLRRELEALGSWAAVRQGKQQQALSFGAFRTLARERLLDRLAGDPDLFGLDTVRLGRLAASDRPAPDGELRLLWLVHSYLSWRERSRAAFASAALPRVLGGLS